jgi:hypothetical protein
LLGYVSYDMHLWYKVSGEKMFYDENNIYFYKTGWTKVLHNSSSMLYF